MLLALTSLPIAPNFILSNFIQFSIFKSGTPDHPHFLRHKLEQTSPPSNHKSGPHIPKAQHLHYRTSVPTQFLMKLFCFVWVPHCLSLHKKSANEFWIRFPFYIPIITSQTHSHSFTHSLIAIGQATPQTLSLILRQVFHFSGNSFPRLNNSKFLLTLDRFI